MSDEPKKKSRAWMWWAPFAAIAFYLLSAFPVVLTVLWLIKAGVVSERNASAFIDTTYAPLNWAEKRSETVRDIFNRIGKTLQPLAPP
jgi:hypothetical protein